MKNIEWTVVNTNKHGEGTAIFDMSNVVIKANGTEITLDNADFEKLITEYQRRKEEIAGGK